MTAALLFTNNSASASAHTPDQLQKHQLGWLCLNTNFARFRPVECRCSPNNGEHGTCEICNAEQKEAKSRGPSSMATNHALASKQRNLLLANEGELTYKFNLEWWTDYTPDQLWRVWNLAVIAGRCMYVEEPMKKDNCVDKAKADEVESEKAEPAKDANEIDRSDLQTSEPLSPTFEAEGLESYELVSCDPEWDDEALWEEQEDPEYGDYSWDEGKDIDSTWEEENGSDGPWEEDEMFYSSQEEVQDNDLAWEENMHDEFSREEEEADDSGWEKVGESKSGRTKRLMGDLDDE